MATARSSGEHPRSQRRRTLYAAVSRNGDKLPSDEFLRLFDFPSARATVSERSVSTVPQQSLFLLKQPVHDWPEGKLWPPG